MNGLPPIRALTSGPRYHWFGYYDKLEVDPAGRYVLGMAVDFEGRSPRPDDVVQIGMVDLAAGDRWIALGESRAWGWQQGCMLQWRPGSTSEILWNDRVGDAFVSHVLDTRTGARRTLSRAIYAASPDGRTALCADFARINERCAGYGYVGLPDPNRDIAAPADAGIYHMDMQTGASRLIVSIAQVAAIPYPDEDYRAARHYFNHLLFNPDGSRFVFLHRWDYGRFPFKTRMLTCNVDGSGLRVVDGYGQTSHFIWRDPFHILAWAYHPSHGKCFYLYEDGASRVEVVGEGLMTANGHCSYLPDREWILNDTYPDASGVRHLYLYHVPTGRREWLAHLTLPAAYWPPIENEEWRCDLHPRFSHNGRHVIIDSAHGGEGRQMYLIDISAIIDA